MTTPVDELIDAGNAPAMQVAGHGLEKLIREVDAWRSLAQHNTGNVARVAVECGLASLVTHTVWRVGPVTSIFTLLRDSWLNSSYEGELRRQFSVVGSESCEEEPTTTLDLIMEPNPDVEHSYDFIQIEVPHNGGGQLCTYSSLYGGYVIRNEDGHLLAKRVHVYNTRTGVAEYEWTYTPINILEEVRASEELLRCGSTESPIIGSEPLVRVADEPDSNVWLSSNA